MKNDIYDIKIHLLSEREIMKLLLSAYTLGCKHTFEESCKGMDTNELNNFITPQLHKILNNSIS